MIPQTGNDDSRIASAIDIAINIAAAGNTLEASESLRHLLHDFPNSAGLRGYLAWFLSESQRHSEAAEHSQLAVILAPNSEKASLVHFHVLWRGGRRIEALDEMKRYLTTNQSQEYENVISDWSLF